MVVYEYYKGHTDESSENKEWVAWERRGVQSSKEYTAGSFLHYSKKTGQTPRLQLASCFPEPPPAVLMR